MSRFHSYIQSASKILGTYDASKPLMFHLKSFFAEEKKYGSRDRKLIASLCYNYFRLGHALKKVTVEERIMAGLFLSENKTNDMLALLRPAWNEQVGLAVTDKLALLNIDQHDIFPFHRHIGEGIDEKQFSLSFSKQPHLYLRIRPGRQRQVIDKLNKAAVPFSLVNEHCLQLANNTSVEKLLNINREVVIQDRNSQQVLNFLENHPAHFAGRGKIAAWDCCAASGGKSILLYDILKGNVKLTVSDIRENILINLTKRLQEAGINIYKKFMADISKEAVLPAGDSFPVILCDTPCTGSGTWGRTPEQLFYFKEHVINEYAERQKKIVSNIIPNLQPGGLFFYITCSVFKEENEEIVAYISEKFNLPLLQKEYLEGYETKADTMFVAVFTK